MTTPAPKPTKVEAKPLTEERIGLLRDRIAKVRTAMTAHHPFLGHLLLKLEPRVAYPGMGITTAGVSRDRGLYVNADFADTLNDAEFCGLLCHEVLHLALLCFERQGGRVATIDDGGRPVSLWNIAHDYAINLLIAEMTETISDVKLPEGGCLDDKYKEMSAEEIYNDLLEKVKKSKGKGDGKGGVKVPKWGADDLRPDLDKGNGQDGDKKDGDQDGDQDGDADGDGEGDDRPGKAPMSEAEMRAQDEFWKQALVEADMVHQRAMQKKKGMNQGVLPAMLRSMIDAIINPKISWIDVLSRWIGTNGRVADFSYRRPSRRSEAVGEILPVMVKNGVDDIVVLWDSSGSMNGRETEIMSEVIGICMDMHMSIRVICCDAMICSDQSGVESPEDIDFAGGGGSNFLPAFDRLHEEGYQGVVVVFTDGYITVPDVKPPHIRDVLWMLFENGNGKDVDPTGGRWGEAISVGPDGFIKSMVRGRDEAAN